MKKSKNSQVAREGSDGFLWHQRYNMIEWLPEGQRINK
jgi:hypothetical protein